MKITLDVKRTNVCTCKHCGYEAMVHRHLLFDSAAVYFNRLHLLIHAITHHWALLPHKAHWMAPYYLLRWTLAFRPVLGPGRAPCRPVGRDVALLVAP